MSQAFKWTSSALTHTGKVRSVNEDSLLDRPEAQLWVVADGMGGHTAGDVASQAIVNSLNFLNLTNDLGQAVDSVENCLIEVNRTLLEEASQREKPTTIGSTVVALLARHNIALFMWVGDSRIYRYRNGVLTQLSQDHTQVEELVQKGLLSPEEAEIHPASNIITRAVGASHTLYVDLDYDEVESGDTYLLCSDGLNKELNEKEITEILNSPQSLEQLCLELMNNCLNRKAKDNISIVLARAE